jgi:hypothetical protein
VIPEITPGSESGSTTRGDKHVHGGLAPKSSAASRMRSSIFLSAV